MAITQETLTKERTAKEKKGIREFAEALVKEHLGDGWKFVLSANYYLGYCCHKKKEIGIKYKIMNWETQDNIKQLLLHEIAHAIVCEEYGNHHKTHGPKFYEVCNRLGCNNLTATGTYRTSNKIVDAKEYNKMLGPKRYRKAGCKNN